MIPGGTVWLQPVTGFRVEMHQCGGHCTVLLPGHSPEYSGAGDSGLKL